MNVDAHCRAREETSPSFAVDVFSNVTTPCTFKDPSMRLGFIAISQIVEILNSESSARLFAVTFQSCALTTARIQSRAISILYCQLILL